MGQQLGYQAYRSAPQSPRQVESALLMRITRGLREARDSGDRIALIKAATENKVLWIAFVTDLLGGGNQLPDPLRLELARLGQTVIREITENLHKNLDVDFLIDINTAIIEGLTAQTAAAPAP